MNGLTEDSRSTLQINMLKMFTKNPQEKLN